MAASSSPVASRWKAAARSNQFVSQDHLGVARVDPGADLGCQVDQRGEEGAEDRFAAPQPGKVGELTFGHGQTAQDRVGVFDQ